MSIARAGSSPAFGTKNVKGDLLRRSPFFIVISDEIDKYVQKDVEQEYS